MNNTQNTTDNSKVCHIGLSGVRKHTSFRCDSKLWTVFKQVCKENGLSTCDILEKLIMGFCIGITQPSVAHPATIYVVVDAPRVVRRVRRRQLVFEGEVECVVEGGGGGRCDFLGCGQTAVAKAVHTSGAVKNVCQKHLVELQNHPKWRIE